MENKYLIMILAATNLITFILYGADKRKAVKNKWRISEKTLITAAFLFGGAGAMAGMHVFRHKTRHIKFRILVPVALVLNIVLIILYLMK